MGDCIKGGRPSLQNVSIQIPESKYHKKFLAIMDCDSFRHPILNPWISNEACYKIPTSELLTKFPEWSPPSIYDLLQSCGMLPVAEYEKPIPSHGQKIRVLNEQTIPGTSVITTPLNNGLPITNSNPHLVSLDLDCVSPRIAQSKFSDRASQELLRVSSLVGQYELPFQSHVDANTQRAENLQQNGISPISYPLSSPANPEKCEESEGLVTPDKIKLPTGFTKESFCLMGDETYDKDAEIFIFVEAPEMDSSV